MLIVNLFNFGSLISEYIDKYGIRLFYCYASEDSALRARLETHLQSSTQHRFLLHWHDGMTNAGEEREKAVDIHIDNADLILLLISPDFLASDYCSKQTQRALERSEMGLCDVIRVILRPTDWKDAPFSHLQVLPENAKAVTSWRNRDEAFENIAQNIRGIIKRKMKFLKVKEEWLSEGHAFIKLKYFDKALRAYEQAVLLDPEDNSAQIYKSYALSKLGRYAEALELCERVMRLTPSYAFAYTNKGYALDGLKRYEEAIDSCKFALDLDPDDAMAHNNMGYALHHLCRYQESIEAFECAVKLNPSYAIAYANMSSTLEKLKKPTEAQNMYEKARQLGYDYQGE